MTEIFKVDKLKILEKALHNAQEDRKLVNVAIVSAMEYISKSQENHKTTGMVLGKYLDVLQKANEQIIRISQLSNIETSEDDELDEIFDEIKKSKEKK